MLSKIYKRKLTLVPAEIRLPPGGKRIENTEFTETDRANTYFVPFCVQN